MLEKLVIIPSFVSLSTVGQADLPNSSSFIYHQKPPLYAQAESLNNKLRQADDIARNNPISAIPFYRNVMLEKGLERDEAIEKLMRIFDKLVDPVEYEKNRWHFENALSFYDDVIKNHQDSKHIGMAHLKSGKIIFNHIYYMPEKLKNVMSRYENAYKIGEKIGDKNLMAEARFNQGYTVYFAITGLIINNEIAHALEIEAMKHRYRRSLAQNYFEEVIKLVPGTDLARRATNLLSLVQRRYRY